MRKYKRINFEKADYLRNPFTKWVELRLKFFIESNRIYEIITDADGVKWFSYLPEVRYRVEKDRVYISFCLDGSSFSDSFRDLSQKLSDCFNMSCISRTFSNGYIDYCLVYPSYFEPFQIDDDTDFRDFSNDEYIKLSDSVTWYIDKSPHFLLVGNSGSGKTYMLYYLLRCFMAQNFDIRIIDAKKATLSRYGRAIGVPTASDADSVIDLLRDVCMEIDKRFSDADSVDVSLYTLGLRPCFVIFDEFAEFMGSLDSAQKKECSKYLRTIILKGREARVFMGLTSQTAKTDYIPTEIRNGLGLRVAFQELTESGYQMVFGDDFKHVRPRFTDRGCGLVFVNGSGFSTPLDYKAPYIVSPWIF